MCSLPTNENRNTLPTCIPPPGSTCRSSVKDEEQTLARSCARALRSTRCVLAADSNYSEVGADFARPFLPDRASSACPPDSADHAPKFERTGIDKMCRRKKSSNVAPRSSRLIPRRVSIGGLVGFLAVVSERKRRRTPGKVSALYGETRPGHVLTERLHQHVPECAHDHSARSRIVPRVSSGSYHRDPEHGRVDKLVHHLAVRTPNSHISRRCYSWAEVDMA